MDDIAVRPRPVTEADLAMFQRFSVEPGLIGRDWNGFRDARQPARRFATDGYLGTGVGRLIVAAGPDERAAGFVSGLAGHPDGA